MSERIKNLPLREELPLLPNGEPDCTVYHETLSFYGDDCPICEHETNCNGYHTDEDPNDNADANDGWLDACDNCPRERAR